MPTELVEQRQVLVGDVTRLTNRITAALTQYFPQVLEWLVDKNTLVFCASQSLTHAQARSASRLSEEGEH